jgi:DNA-binding LytR/AlgR family response regulator
MKIVVFDDNQNDMERLVGMLTDWSQNNQCRDVIISEYSSIAELEVMLDDVNFPDVFFLDIMTPERVDAGFLLAERIHVRNPNANIIFETNSPEYWSSAFEISALHYLMKPVQRDKVYKILDSVYQSPSKRTASTVMLPGFGQTLVVEYDKLLYIDAQTEHHRAVAHLTDGTEIELSLAKIGFSDLMSEFLSDDFARCHRSIIVNLNYVLKYDTNSVTMKNCSSRLELGRKYRTEFVNKMIDHHKGLRKI